MKSVLGLLVPGLFLFFFISCAHEPVGDHSPDESPLSPVSDNGTQIDESDAGDSGDRDSGSDDHPEMEQDRFPEENSEETIPTASPEYAADGEAADDISDDLLTSESGSEEILPSVQPGNDFIDSTESPESTGAIEEESGASVFPGDGSFLPLTQNPGGQKKHSREKEAQEKITAAEGEDDTAGVNFPEQLNQGEISNPPQSSKKPRFLNNPLEIQENPLIEDSLDAPSGKETVPVEKYPEDIGGILPSTVTEDVSADEKNPLLSEDIPFSQDSQDPDDSPASPDYDPVPERDIRPGIQVQVIEEDPEQFSGSEETRLPEENAARPSRWLDAPGEFTVTLDGRGWVFRSDLSTPGSWRFLERERDGESTRFRFLFDEKGQWSLVFERQDLSSGGSLRETRTVKVGEGENAIIENGPPGSDKDIGVPGLLPGNPDERDSIARLAAETGRPDEAMALWERDAGRNDDAGRRARKALVEQAVDTAAVHVLIDWLPSYLEDGADSTLLSDALNLLQEHAGYQSLENGILENLAADLSDPRRPEWLYRLARLLEEPGEGRNLDRAGALYAEVTEGWPYSDWSDLSQERLAWLRRYYFRVR